MRIKTNPEFSPDQKACIEMLAEWAHGHHHLPEVKEWGNGVCINHSGGLSTYDFDKLTRLVLLAHRDAVRIDVSSSGPRLVRIIAHKRKYGSRKELSIYERHPNLSELKRLIEEMEPCSERKGEK